MKITIIIGAILAGGFALLAYGRARIKKMQNSGFERVTRSEIRKAHQRMIRNMEETNMQSRRARKLFDQQAKRTIHFFAEQFYGSTDKIPPRKYDAVQKYAHQLREKFRKKVHIF